MSNLNRPGQRAHDVYYSALDGAARLWEMSLDRERSAWAAVEREQTGKAQGCATGDVLDVGTAPNGDCEVILRCSKEQSSHWSKLLYTTVTVLPAPPTKEPTNG